MKPHWANAPSLGSCDSHLALTTNTKHFYNNNIDPLELFPFKIEAFQTFLIFLLCSPLWYPVGWPYFALCYHIVVSSWCYPVKSSASADGLVAVSQLRFLLCRGWKPGSTPISCTKPHQNLGSQFLALDFVEAMGLHPAMSQLRFLFCRGWTARSWLAAPLENDQTYPLENENLRAGVFLQWCQDMLRNDMLWEEPREEKMEFNKGFW